VAEQSVRLVSGMCIIARLVRRSGMVVAWLRALYNNMSRGVQDLDWGQRGFVEPVTEAAQHVFGCVHMPCPCFCRHAFGSPVCVGKEGKKHG